MKIRDGHVSNSSSSSFLTVMTKATFEKAKAASSELAVKLADLVAQHGKLGNEDIVLIAVRAYEGNYFYGQEVLEPKIVKARGCEHSITDAQFCSQCGAEKWVEKKEYPDWQDAWEEFVRNIPNDEQFGELQSED